MKIMTMQFKESYRHSWIETVADDVQSICMFDLLKSEPIISPYQYNLFIKASVDKIRKLHFIHNKLLGDIIIASPILNNFQSMPMYNLLVLPCSAKTDLLKIIQ